MHTLNPKSDHYNLVVRERVFRLEQRLAVDWNRNSQLLTAFFDSISTILPTGEAYFIRAVGHYLDKLADPALKHAAEQFCRQEGGHSREHQRYNDALRTGRNYPIEQMLAPMRKRIRASEEMRGTIDRLADTVAFEHITAVLANVFMREEYWLGGADPEVRRIWFWHMTEEIEHKAIAFDVFRAVGGTERQRRFAFWFAAFFLLKDVYRNMTLILKSQNAWTFRMRLRVLALLFGRQGICRRIRSDIAVFRRPDFHPWQIDNRELLKLVE